MKSIVLYSTKGGNTEKVAGEIASELGCQCMKVAKDFDPSALNLNDYDMVFVGTGNYAGRPNADMLNYLKGIELKNSRQFALFLTWFGRGKSDKGVFDRIKTVLEAKNQKVLDNCYKCQGEGHNLLQRFFAWAMGHGCRGHPDASELSAARTWALALSKAL